MLNLKMAKISTIVRFIIACSLITGVLLTGCASQTKTLPQTGFLTDYSLLKKNEDPKWMDDWIYIKKATTGTHIGMGSASGEAELLDSQTGEVLAAGIDTETGTKYRIDKSVTTLQFCRDSENLTVSQFDATLVY